MDMKKGELSAEIDRVFPRVPMPDRARLFDGKADPKMSAEILDDIERMGRDGVDGAAIRAIHQELSLLSAEMWRWLLPQYLKYCLTEEAQYNRFETEYLIFNLGPELQFQSDAKKRLSLLTNEQLLCLVHFLEWCRQDEWWADANAVDIDRAISLLRVIQASLGDQP